MNNLKKYIIKGIDIFSILINYVIIGVLLLVLAYSIYAILDVNTLYGEAESHNFTAYKPQKNNYKINESFDQLKKKNDDIIGWLDIYGTSIDYPMVQAKDNEKYLNRDVFGNYTAVGSIFLDYRNSGLFKENNNIIYGHHMAHRAMFGDINQFADKQFFDAHKYGNIFFNGKDYGIEILAYFKTHGADKIVYNTKLEGEENISAFLSYIKNISKYHRIDSKSLGKLNDRHFVLLSTCTRETEGRQLLLGVISNQIYANSFEENIYQYKNKISINFDKSFLNKTILISSLTIIFFFLIWIFCEKQERQVKKINKFYNNKI